MTLGGVTDDFRLPRCRAEAARHRLLISDFRRVADLCRLVTCPPRSSLRRGLLGSHDHGAGLPGLAHVQVDRG